MAGFMFVGDWMNGSPMVFVSDPMQEEVQQVKLGIL
jgi:hypothetical protein